MRTKHRSRFSHRHLLALGTFLVPLAVLAVLGASELQRSRGAAQSALNREGRQFLQNASQAIRQQIARTLDELLPASEALLADGPVLAALRLRDDARFVATRCIFMLDEQANLVWPTLSRTSFEMPFAEDAQRRSDNPTRAALTAADALLTQGRHAEAVTVLEAVVKQLETANPPGPPTRYQRPDLDEVEAMARFRLATAWRRLGRDELVAPLLDRVRTLTGGQRRRFLEPGVAALNLLAEAMLAELGTRDQRLGLLRDIAEGHRDQADGLLNAVALRLADSFADDAPERTEVTRLLAAEAQRAATRGFAASYEYALKYDLRRRLPGNQTATVPTRLVTTLNGETMLIAVRPATPEEAGLWSCTYVAVRLDLGTLLGPTLQRFAVPDGTFVLAVEDPDRVAIVPPPPLTPPDYDPPQLDTGDLTLRAFPADPARLVADAEAAVRQRSLLLTVLVVTALGGALWSWRSVSREAELASMKIDLVSRVSHELKTPLALIRMYGETLGFGRARDSQQAAEFGSIIAREADRLTTLIQRILDFSRQQAGTLQYAPRRHDLGDLLRSIAGAYAPHLEARGALLIDDLPHDIVVECDANACESAVVNLLENAAKYACDGETEQEIELVLRSHGGNAVIEVRDRGRGIPEAERERVFEGFYRASNSGEVRGAGLGLSLVRHFATAHGGHVEALANPGGGTILRLTLPLLPQPDLPPPSPPSGARREQSNEPS
ncbi:MAG: HAMP domain-containing histidine kinase [Planctomycetes bacterium]|nr:HAMP domain-containing histidine kinase [Planctomycetota bacterium]